MTNDFFTNIPDYSGIGIYALINNRTGKMYIGASQNIHQRIMQPWNFSRLYMKRAEMTRFYKDYQSVGKPTVANNGAKRDTERSQPW